MLNLSMLLEDSAREAPDQTAVVCGEQRLTYAALDAAASQTAGRLVELGVKPGDRVALSCPNVPQFPIAYYGILKTGAVVVPLNILLKPNEIAYHLNDSGAKVYCCFADTPQLPIGTTGAEAFAAAPGCERLLPLTPTSVGVEGQPPVFSSAATAADDTAVVLYTSGTTGQPKGAELTHLNLLLNARLGEFLYPGVDRDVHLVALPLFHSFGQSVQMNAGLGHRATLVLLPRFTPGDALALMERHGVTFFAGVPTMYWALLNDDTAGAGIDVGRIARTLRVALSGGAGMPLEVLKGFEEKFDVRILEGYGLSETSPVATCNSHARERRPGTVGRPVWGVAVRAVGEDGRDVPTGQLGEIVIRGHNVMKGYLGRPEATAAAIRDGWLHTGDLGRIDADGYVSIVDRSSDMILRGGFNVYPRELEEVLLGHPEVSLCAVVGVADERLGQEIKAFVVRRPGAAVTEDELIAWCKERMASYKYPRSVEFRTDLPMTASGKILKRELPTG